MSWDPQSEEFIFTVLGTWYYLGVESLSEESETSEPWVSVSESLLDAPEVGVGLGCALGVVREDRVLVDSVLHGTGLERSHPDYFCIPAPLVSPQTSRRLVENSNGVRSFPTLCSIC